MASAGRLDAGALAPGVAFDHDRKRAAGSGGGLRQAGDHGRIVGGDRHVGLGLQRAEAGHLLLADQIVADQDVVDPGIRHHLGLAELLAGDALGAGRDLHLRQQRALVGLDMRPVGDAGGIAGRLDARDVALDAVHVDDGAGRAVFAGDFGGEGRGHGLLSLSPSYGERSETIHLVKLVHDGYRFAPPILRSSLFYLFPQHFQLQPPVFGRRSSFCAFAIAAEAASNFLRSLV